jgi:hypothetical protein
MPRSENIPALFWLWLPLAFMAVQIGLELTLPSYTLSRMHSEGGSHEIIQFLLMVAAALVAARALLMRQTWARAWLLSWVALAFFACVYVAGEEISWGQHLVNWETPEFWSGINDQNETNLHNTTSWLDQKPRMILMVGILIGGLVVPLLQKFKPAWVPARFAILYPPAVLGVSALIVLVVNIIRKIDGLLPDVVFFTRGSEVEELYMFYFVLLYLLILRRRLMQNQG